MAEIAARELEAQAADGHRWRLLARIPPGPRASLLWLPAMGVAARHYLPFAEALAARGVAVFVHEWRGHGSSGLRADRRHDWGYRELLELDLPASEALVARAVPGVPRIAGGHSLGGQLACCRRALAPDAAQALWLVGSGAPYWRAFPPRTRWWLPLAYRLLRWLAERNGALPGRRIGFGGREARGLIRDWSRSGLTGRYAAAGLRRDLEAALAEVATPVHAVVLAQDWLAPESSLRFLLAKLPRAPQRVDALDAAALGAHADHYAWMRRPQAVAERLLHPLD
ncbi:alpha/beta hydrolase family protein [Vulcaniibacterium tengchongense]|uniref:Putative alpha/beta hydrolase n=1 Tax=Vulcaniibacterium tengchongense TaxID=1273429 RepID=A0A3N4VEC9_9GAMM|nr:alpha/beta hydrolase [Vulcaniibacterium tengchongense]RPE81346.1 putative alpha/beta hydrolase [Vulcaniibacterium tengchongense]